MDSEGLNEFAPPATGNPLTELKPPEIKIESHGEIISSLFEGKVTQDKGERQTILTLRYGDLPSTQRGSRQFEEVLWTDQKQSLSQVYLAPLAPEGLSPETTFDYMVCGTNGTFCFALKGDKKMIRGYLNATKHIEEVSLDQELGHRFSHMKTQGDATEMMNLLNVLLKREPAFEKMLRGYLANAEKTLLTLPEGKETYSKDAHATERVFPVVSTLEHTLLEYNSQRQELQEADEYELMCCNTSKLNKSPGWTKAKMGPIKVRRHTMPCITSNETHLAILFQPFDEMDPTVVTVYMYRLNEHPAQKECARFFFQFPAEHFKEQGMLNLQLNDAGILSVSFANGVVVIDTTPGSAEGGKPRIVLCPPRIVTATATHEKDLLMLGTNGGECVGLLWKTGDIVFSEITPVVEPIYSIHYSNKRVIMHTACAITARLNPYLTTAMTYLPTARLTGLDVCGTLMFAVEKYGNIQIFPTLVRKVIFPFKEPKQHYRSRPIPQEKKTPQADDPSKGKESPPPPGFEYVDSVPYYTSIKVTPGRIVVLYPNGLIRIFSISPEGYRWIEEQMAASDPKKKKKDKKKNGKK